MGDRFPGELWPVWAEVGDDEAIPLALQSDLPPTDRPVDCPALPVIVLFLASVISCHGSSFCGRNCPRDKIIL